MQPHRHDGLRPGVFWPVPPDPTGRTGPTRAQQRGAGWRCSSRGRWVPAAVPRTTEQRIIEAAAMLPPVSGVTGWAALHWCGRPYFAGVSAEGRPRAVPVLMAGSQIRVQPDVLRCTSGLRPGDLQVVDGVPLTSEVMAVCFEARFAEDLADAVAVLDMAAYSDAVSLVEVGRFLVTRVRPAEGTVQLRRALALAEENSWSPMETHTRLVWEGAGLPRPLCNRPIFAADGRHLGTPDLLDPDAGLVVEYDGKLHLTGRRRAVDIRREERFRAAGLEVMVVLASHLADRGALARRMIEVRGRALARRTEDRRWSTRLPPWWIPTHTVEQRRALPADLRARLLARRGEGGGVRRAGDFSVGGGSP